MAQNFSAAITHRLVHDPACRGRGCPACTGLTWPELDARQRDALDNERDAAAARDDHERDWQTR